MSFVHDDKLIETFLTDRANPAFRVSVGVRGATGRMDYLDVLRSKNLIKGGVELGVPIIEQIPKDRYSVFNRPAKLVGLLRSQMEVGCSVQPVMWMRRVSNSVKKST